MKYGLLLPPSTTSSNDFDLRIKLHPDCIPIPEFDDEEEYYYEKEGEEEEYVVKPKFGQPLEPEDEEGTVEGGAGEGIYESYWSEHVVRLLK